jgi:hypothetical protein
MNWYAGVYSPCFRPFSVWSLADGLSHSSSILARPRNALGTPLERTNVLLSGPLISALAAKGHPSLAAPVFGTSAAARASRQAAVPSALLDRRTPLDAFRRLAAWGRHRSSADGTAAGTCPGSPRVPATARQGGTACARNRRAAHAFEWRRRVPGRRSGATRRVYRVHRQTGRAKAG